MFRIFLPAFFFLMTGILNAQSSSNNSISGKVTDSISGHPLEYATITLFIKGNTKPLTGTITDNSGSFELKDLRPGSYKIVFEFIGYKSHSINNLLLNKNSAIVDLKTIHLVPQHKELQSVTIVSKTKLLENKIDKMVFNAEKDLTSQSGVATDVLKKIPQVSVDVDGNVQLAGSSGVRFLINGKPSTAFGSSITDVLQSIPASQIKAVEVITNPGAKYDAQGLGGIINIILKTSNAKGSNGNLSLTAGSRMENGSFNFNLRNNNFGINAFLSANKRLNARTPFNSERLAYHNDTVNSLIQSGPGYFERYGTQAGVGFDWTVKKLNSFSGSFSLNHFGNSGNRSILQVLQDDKGGTIPAVLSTINTDYVSRFENVDASLNYKRTFAKEDQELEISLNSSFGKELYRSSNDQSLLPQDSLFYGSSSNNPGKTRETEVNIDYTQPLKKDVMLGLGSKGSFYTINSTSSVSRYQPLQQAYIPDQTLSNDLVYKQQVYAFYSELAFPVLNWFQAKLGGRYERTEISSYYANAQQQVKVPGYNTFVPSVFLSKKITDDQTIKLSYSKRIERPDYGDLNPFVNTNDPKNLSAGNPYLQPEIGHRIELGYNRDLGKTGSMMINFFYRINEHDIQPYINYYTSYKVGDSVYTNVAVSTRQNIGMEKNLGINIFGDLHATTKLNIRGNLFFFRRHTVNQLDAGFNYNSFNYRFNMNASYQFTNTLLAEFFGNFNSARHEAQGTYPSFTSYSLAVRKQFWKKKGSLALTANNFLSEYITQRTILTGSGFTVNGTRKIPFRSVGLNFAWKFGKLEFKKNKPEGESNMNAPAE